ncbi:MAG: cytochrome d ubiquinol oxidase subunit II [Anaerolineae bacterium]|nr:cytochrome d ubiquinol oxidase subunit II [Anaerolineae bacterium]MDW8173851.1 cytochrome d ubiquinol oxidase subunit II [Anaerolineae bacterium]
MELQVLWFLLIAVLFTGFLFLEGFDYGVGILLPFVAKDDRERRVVVNSIGPFWDGNEVWLLTAGGAIFAAFPHWYATLFSGFYLALFLILVALILRGVAFEFRSKDDSPRWRAMWDGAIFFGSFVPALLWGVAFGNILRGVAIDASMTYVGSFFDLLNPYALVGGLVTLSLFILHGALFLELKTGGVVQERAKQVTRRAIVPVIVLALVFVGLSLVETDILQRLNVANVLGLVAAVVGLLAGAYFIFSGRFGRAFAATGVVIVGVVALIFGTLFPRVMPSSLGEAFDLTIFNASSSPYTLQVMTVIALTVVPFVLLYQGWTYWVFRKRLTTDSHLEY